MDAKLTKENRGELECPITDARGPFGLGQRCGLLAGWQAAGVGFVGRDRQAVGRRLGSAAADAQGPFGLGQGCGLLAGRQAAGVGFGR